ncbi:MAG TPA: hypothetical protein DCP31_08510 [Cyanobacteria bacterium UBA8543]|nr:hypothetical protein [Cyanobacteria bacterium UBA8543]
MDDLQLLLNVTAVLPDAAEEEEQLYFWDASITANAAVTDFVKGRIDIDTFADKLEAIGVDIEDYFLTLESNLEFSGLL